MAPKVDCKVYTAFKLTGRTAKDVNKINDRIKSIFAKYGLTVLSPWDYEKHNYRSEDKIKASKKLLATRFWPRDKELIREAHVLCDTTGDLFSRGASVEAGISRQGLMRPTVWVDKVAFSVRSLDGDLVVPSLEKAAKEIARRWGTAWKRRAWRLKTVWSPRCIKNRIVGEINGWR